MGHVEVDSISGDVHLKGYRTVGTSDSGRGGISYDGDFSSGGEYRFTTHTGDIRVLVPGGCVRRLQGALGARPRAARLSSQTETLPLPEEVGRSFFGTPAGILRGRVAFFQW